MRRRGVLALNLWLRARRVARLLFGSMGEGLSPFPYALVFPQDEHERVLIEQLRRAGVEVERATELVGFDRHEDAVLARFASADGHPAPAPCEASYLVGCDGASSTVRRLLGVGSRRHVRARLLRGGRRAARPGRRSPAPRRPRRC